MRSGTTRTAPRLPHTEGHFTAGEVVRDVVIGMSDGLTVPFALAAGISGAIASSHVVVTAGLAEVAAGSIAMGLGGFLAARGEADHYRRERRREEAEIVDKPEFERREVLEILGQHGLDEAEARQVLAGLERRPEAWIDFMMRFELDLSRPDSSRAWKSAVTIGASYAIGGLVPLIPYFFVAVAARGLLVSVAVTLVALAVFGYFKGLMTGARPVRSAIETVLIGGVASAAAFTLARRSPEAQAVARLSEA